eukprot:scaffold176821_cov46-Prasinocladus_malaysianus.AAC.2
MLSRIALGRLTFLGMPQELLGNIATLSSVFHKPPESFTSKLRIAVAKGADLETHRFDEDELGGHTIGHYCEGTKGSFALAAIAVSASSATKPSLSYSLTLTSSAILLVAIAAYVLIHSLVAYNMYNVFIAELVFALPCFLPALGALADAAGAVPTAIVGILH